ncbi:MAG TPA: c-type cytochrome [Gemmatimonadaceae bacterium]|nr:c-type cytochrome [Gemmatimonadaceae bacterium]
MHESYIQAGGVRVLPIENPMAGDARAIAHGKELFVRYNCSGCHGDDGAGNWAPALNDGRWRYGGTPGEIYQSIYEGRPMGMPAFGERVPASQLWELAAYLKSLETGAPIATQGAREWAGTGKSGKEQTQ